MSARLHILDGGLQTAVQDEGRQGWLSLGVARSGALDPLSFRLANRLAGNRPGLAALELRSPGPVLRVEGGPVRAALTGTSASLIVERAHTNGEPAAQEWASWRAVDLQDGDVVRIAPFADTAVAYLAFSGGLDVPDVLGSRSTFMRGGFGGHEGRALAAGDQLMLADGVPDGPCLTLLKSPRISPSVVLRAIAGPQLECFTGDAVRTFFNEAFTVTRDLDRMGMRFEGPALRHTDKADILSDATVPGAVQVPGSRQPILLLNDCQSTGGYAKIAVVISADLPLAARLLPGAQVRFREVGIAQAEEARAEAEHAYRGFVHSLVPVRG